jgi:hypothetical protein
MFRGKGLKGLESIASSERLRAAAAVEKQAATLHQRLDATKITSSLATA